MSEPVRPLAEAIEQLVIDAEAVVGRVEKRRKSREAEGRPAFTPELNDRVKAAAKALATFAGLDDSDEVRRFVFEQLIADSEREIARAKGARAQ